MPLFFFLEKVVPFLKSQQSLTDLKICLGRNKKIIYNPITQRPEALRKMTESYIMKLIIKETNFLVTFDQTHFASMYSAHFLPAWHLTVKPSPQLLGMPVST